MGTPEISKYDTWHITRDSLGDSSYQARHDTVFSLSNGLVGARASMPFCPRGTRGTYVNGLYADAPSSICWIPKVGFSSRDSERFPTDELVNAHTKNWGLVVAPNIFFVEPQHRDIISDTSSLVPTLDMRNGTLSMDGDVRLGDVTLGWSSLRLVSKSAISVAAERIRITKADGDAPIAVLLSIDDTVLTYRYSEGFDLWKNRSFEATSSQIVQWTGVTKGKENVVSIALGCSVAGPGGYVRIAEDGQGFEIGGDGEVVIDRFVGISCSGFDSNPQKSALHACEQARSRGFDAVRADHVREWDTLWNTADMEIEEAPDDQQAIRYSIFQVCAATVTTDLFSIGAKFLSAEGYHGMVFWDMDVFIVPFLIRTLPHLAKHHLEFRFRGLEQARIKAQAHGYKGAMYPWQATPGGEEGMAPWIILRRTQVHVVADIAWAVVEYVNWTGDTEFMREKGAAILIETARFWMSRIDHERGEIREICGPDEANPRVNNNAYTNFLAMHNLHWAAQFGENATTEERRAFSSAANRLKQKLPRESDGVVEQYDGLFESPSHSHKQSDVAVLPMLFPGILTKEQLAANVAFYAPATDHRSSLSKGPFAICMALAGKIKEAYEFWRDCAFLDLRTPKSQTGLHSACCGNVPSIITQGFCGMQLTEHGLQFETRLPARWTRVSFTVLLRGTAHRITLTDGQSLTVA